ncbi:MAG TPA: nucleotide exchange factor GrpE [Thermoanaerobaculia bacterium]|nr:nucleotide exchange factor GrpE [Thermoanaerobaculia bacterium]
MRSDVQETPTADELEIPQTALLDTLARELGSLRKTVLRQGHAQELFQARVEEAVSRLPRSPERAGPPPSGLNSAQVRTLLELDQAILQLLRLSQMAQTPQMPNPEETVEEAPVSLREGLSLLQVRVRNLQHSLGLEAIPAQNQFFDDRWHEASGVAHRPDLPDGWVVEEVLPGYRLGERVVRPARVVVNRCDRGAQ